MIHLLIVNPTNLSDLAYITSEFRETSNRRQWIEEYYKLEFIILRGFAKQMLSLCSSFAVCMVWNTSHLLRRLAQSKEVALHGQLLHLDFSFDYPVSAYYSLVYRNFYNIYIYWTWNKYEAYRNIISRNARKCSESLQLNQSNICINVTSHNKNYIIFKPHSNQ